MIIGMTGYGSAKFESKNLAVSLNIRSYNSKFLNVDCPVPKDYIYVEQILVKEIKKRIQRGRVICSLNIEEQEGMYDVAVQWDILQKKIDSLKEIAKRLGIKYEISLNDVLMSEPLVLHKTKQTADEKTIVDIVQKLAAQAIDELNELRAIEGEQIFNEINKHLSVIRGYFSEIEKNKDVASADIEKRLRSKMAKHSSEYDKNRLSQEIVFYLDKLDITEEINRFNGFFETFGNLLQEGKPLIGKQLDFVLMEMNREINTVGSKANNVDISNAVINIKAELEKIREQVQNVQ